MPCFLFCRIFGLSLIQVLSILVAPHIVTFHCEGKYLSANTVSIFFQHVAVLFQSCPCVMISTIIY